MLTRAAYLCLALAGLSLAACGTSKFNRATTGAGMGAATGALIGAVAPPFGPGVGALVGAGLGGTIGAGTSANQIDLGKPVWSGSGHS